MSHWYYKDEVFNPKELDAYGFIYKITYEYNEQEFTYLGKKNFYSITEIDSLKSGKPRPNHYKFVNRNRNGKRVKREIIRKESNWRTYLGSCKDTRIKDMIVVDCEILKIIPLEDNAKQTLSYWENYYLFTEEVLFDDNNLNGNIQGKWYSGNVIGSKEYIK